MGLAACPPSRGALHLVGGLARSLVVEVEALVVGEVSLDWVEVGLVLTRSPFLEHLLEEKKVVVAFSSPHVCSPEETP